MSRQFLFALLVLLAAPLQAAEPVALVTELSGSGTLGVKPRASPLELLQDLVPGARLSLDRGARATVVHTATGFVYELTGPGSFRVHARSIDAGDAHARLARRELPPEIRAYKLDPSAAVQASIVLRGGAEVRLDGPDGGVLAADELRYRILGELREARFEVFDEQGAPAFQLEPPEGVVALEGRHAWVPGQRYRVQASGNDRAGRPVTLKAHFTIVPPDTLARLRAGRPADAAARTDWIVYALALESVGANASARPIWKALAESR